jgi:hypothetical protein
MTTFNCRPTWAAKQPKTPKFPRFPPHIAPFLEEKDVIHFEPLWEIDK